MNTDHFALVIDKYFYSTIIQISSSVSVSTRSLPKAPWIKKLSQAFSSLFLCRLSIAFAFKQCHFLLKPLLLSSISTFIWRSPPLITHLCLTSKAFCSPPPRLHLVVHLFDCSILTFLFWKHLLVHLFNLAAPSFALVYKKHLRVHFTRIIFLFYLKVSPRTAPSSLTIESIT